MKKFISIILTVVVLTSCSSTNLFNKGPFQKRKYTKGYYINKKSNTTLANNKKEVVPISFLKETIENDHVKQVKTENITSPAIVDAVSDSVKIVLKNGDTYTGVTVSEDDTGYSLQQNNGRIVYLVKSEIKEVIDLHPKVTSTIIKAEKVVVKEEIDNWDSNPKPNVVAIPIASKISFAIFLLSLLFSFTLPLLALSSFILGLIISIIGYNIAIKNPSSYSEKRANIILWLYLAPLSLLLVIMGIALILLVVLLVFLFVVL
jgi:small nuclear ribonucleoprotein (snRNP)-like protein